jgi:hypothetical protein
VPHICPVLADVGVVWGTQPSELNSQHPAHEFSAGGLQLDAAIKELQVALLISLNS